MGLDAPPNRVIFRDPPGDMEIAPRVNKPMPAGFILINGKNLIKLLLFVVR
jgi:hypothetical protein